MGRGPVWGTFDSLPRSIVWQGGVGETLPPGPYINAAIVTHLHSPGGAAFDVATPFTFAICYSLRSCSVAEMYLYSITGDVLCSPYLPAVNRLLCFLLQTGVKD